MPTAAENKNPPTMAANDIGAGQAVRGRLDENSRDAAADADEYRLGKKLQRHNLLRADRHPQSDLPRVRLVTETSRMSRMPMSPNTGDIDATAANRSAMMRLLPSAVRGEFFCP
jgi:hypothetical protein